MYGEIITTTKEEKLPLKVTYTGDETKDYGYINEIIGKDGRVVTTIESRLNKKTNTVEEISRTSVRTEAVNTVITKGIKSKIEEIKIPREVVYEEDASVEKGKDVVKQEGEDGKTITTTTYVLNSKTGEITEKVTVEKKEKTDKIIVRGTKEVVSEPEIIEVPTDPKIIPNEDSATTEPSTPAKPEASGKEGQPVQPGTPAQPEASGQPSTPVKPEAKEEQPVQPGTPTQPEVSGQPSTPTNPAEEKQKEETPKVPEKQEKPVQPENSGKEETSVSPAEEKQKEETPKVPEKQEKPVQPGNSGKEGISTTPAEEKQKEEKPTVPEKQEKPVQPEKQTEPAQPGTTEATLPTPVEEKPKEEKPTVPEKQEKPVQPENSGKQETPTKPVEEKPKEEKPSVQEKREKPEQPETPAKPGTSEIPAEEKPKEEKPTVPEKQEKPVQPENSGKEGTSTTPVEEKPKEESSYKSDENNVLKHKLKTLFLTALDNRVSLELYDVDIDDIEFRAVEIEDEKAINTVKDKLQGNKNVRIYDLSLYKGGKEISLDNNRLVRIALAKYENKNVEIYHVESDGHLTKIPSIINNDNVEFYINHFSQFAIVSDKNNLSKTDAKNAISKENSLKQQSLPKTGMSNTNDFSLLAIISLLVLVLSRKQKNSMK